MAQEGAWPPIAVCVPVRDERTTLPVLIDALARQRGIAGRLVTACFLFDDCSDGSETLVEAAARDLPMILATGRRAGGGPPNAGAARRAALALGEAATGHHPSALLLTTDADSVPADDWIARNLAALAGADVVAGRIRRADAAPGDAPGRLERYYDRLHALRREIDPVPWEPAPAHHFTGGASLAFRAPAYRALGGFAERPSGEDAAIVDAAHRLGLRVRRDRAVLVETSARRCGRAPDGLAANLRRLDAQRCGTTRVGDPAAAVWQYEGQALARALFSEMPGHAALGRLERRLGLPRSELVEVAGECANAEAFAMRVVPAAPGSESMVTLDEAEIALARLARDRLERAA